MRDRLAAFFDLWSKGFLILILGGIFGGFYLLVVFGITNASVLLVDLANRTLYSSAQAATLKEKYLQGAWEVLLLALFVISAPPFFFKLLSGMATFGLLKLPAGDEDGGQSRTESLNSLES
jgi:hypothetical protein